MGYDHRYVAVSMVLITQARDTLLQFFASKFTG